MGAAPTILTSLSDFLLSPDYSCYQEFGACERQWYYPEVADDAVSRIMASKPEYLQNDDFLEYMYQEITQDTNERPTLSFVHFTDLHLDLDYEVGSATKCHNVMCCRADDGYPTDPSLQAGAYGSLAYCDVPVTVLDKMTEKVNELAPDALFWGGDAVPHD